MALHGAAERAARAESDGGDSSATDGPGASPANGASCGTASPSGASRPSLSRPAARVRARPPSAAGDRASLLELAARLADARDGLLSALAAAPAGGESAAVEPTLVALQFRLADAVARVCRRQRLE